MKQTIELSLSTQGINSVIKQLNAYKKSIDQRCQLLVDRLAEIGIAEAKATIVDYNAIDKGKLYNSIKKVKGRSNKGILVYVRADCDYAVYVEMGTGIMGVQSPYKGAIPVVYAHGEHIHEASKAEANASPYIEEGDLVWWYKKDGKWHITKGQYSKPFMYNASMEMQRRFSRVVREVFK